jgi:TonB family protein
VFLEIIIGRDGKVMSARPLKGEPEFVQAAIAAVKGWRFEPHAIGGEPAAVKTVLTFNFRAE